MLFGFIIGAIAGFAANTALRETRTSAIADKVKAFFAGLGKPKS